jgi:branched-subunit amino acid aminotransferase/4-amino-4-deoxychorismate lyase
MLGDGVWEGIRLHNGVLFDIEDHMDRCYEGCKVRRNEHTHTHSLTHKHTHTHTHTTPHTHMLTATRR